NFEPIILTGILPLAIATTAGNPVDTIPQLVSAARAQPDALNVAVTSPTSKVALELFKQATKAPLFQIAYFSASQSIVDVQGERVGYMIDTVASITAQVHAGNLKVLGVTSLQETELLPGVNSIAEQGVPGFDISGWNAVFAPAGTQPEI